MEAKIRFIDSHAHLTDPSLASQVDAVVARALDAGVERIITIATTPNDAIEAIKLADRFQGIVFVALGIHPHQAEKVGEADLAKLPSLLDDEHVVGFGEMGLDYHYDFADRARQREVFAAQLDMARGRDLPIIIHSREAFDDTSAVLLEHGMAHRKVVFHCFTGSAHEAGCLAEYGWRISFTGIVTFKNAIELQQIAAAYPLDQLMVETDSPYLSPVPVRNVSPNEPAHVVHTARFVAGLKGIDPDAFSESTWTATSSFFNLPVSTSLRL